MTAWTRSASEVVRLRDAIIHAHAQLQGDDSTSAMHTLAEARRKFAEVEPDEHQPLTPSDVARIYGVSPELVEHYRRQYEGPVFRPLTEEQRADARAFVQAMRTGKPWPPEELEDAAERGDLDARAELQRRYAFRHLEPCSGCPACRDTSAERVAPDDAIDRWLRTFTWDVEIDGPLDRSVDWALGLVDRAATGAWIAAGSAWCWWQHQVERFVWPSK